MQHDLDTRHAKEMVELEQQLKSSTTVESKNDSCTLSANMEPLAPSTSLVNDNNDETGTEAEELDELPSESISSSFYASNTSASGAKKPNRQKLRKVSL